MEEQLIIFETAKLAKEKGFKEYTIEAYYDGELSLSSCYDLQEPRKYTPENETYAPTQFLLQKWLREVYNIEIEIRVDDINPRTYIGNIFTKDWDKYFVKDNNNSYYFNLYEEVLELALYQALELIK